MLNEELMNKDYNEYPVSFSIIILFLLFGISEKNYGNIIKEV